MGSDPSPFGELVKKLRERRGMSQNALNKAAGLATGYVSQLESGSRGKRPSRDYVLKIAKGLRADRGETEDLLRAAGRLGNGDTLDVPGRPSFEEFVNSDPLLIREQRDMLLRLYRSYVPRQLRPDQRGD